MLTLLLNRRMLLATAAIATFSGCATHSGTLSVADTIAAKPELSTLSSLVMKTGLTATLKGTGPFTVFAPTNAAFAKVPAKTLDDLGKDTEKLKAVLTYHVIPAKVMAADVKNSNIKTVNGASLAVSKAGDFVTVEDGMVQTADLMATNGIVHVIDSVLIPPPKR